MKYFLCAVFLSFFIIAGISAQDIKIPDVLTPVPANSKSFRKISKETPKSDGLIRYRNLKFKLSVEAVKLPNNKKGIVVTVQTTNDQLVYEDDGNTMQKARLWLYGRITSKDKTKDFFFETIKSVNFDCKAQILAAARDPVILRKVFELDKGDYQIGIILRDLGDRGIQSMKFQIP